jgi:hypothetical protein
VITDTRRSKDFPGLHCDFAFPDEYRFNQGHADVSLICLASGSEEAYYDVR